jgi:hypothetical protein
VRVVSSPCLFINQFKLANLHHAVACIARGGEAFSLTGIGEITEAN